ncbi:uncharacterized protein CMU_031170 [Cryptosporidium muris RN66]|uniref:Uncharacterized protein n=1 Tax=Cryptosporidium muris (strain RN66) TaxID=441375 RepID=B6AID5_CRYMR|nr:uncharacterized protein CMU_031170 [Cryptosporidium muris RN66]EEA07976.1 hypothetical protein, conserved [Cryptosporidium muris RN66]|eukprot:XP_002142325.1 hypothetical protein [Cryptosporidium muris RN66]
MELSDANDKEQSKYYSECEHLDKNNIIGIDMLWIICKTILISKGVFNNIWYIEIYRDNDDLLWSGVVTAVFSDIMLSSFEKMNDKTYKLEMKVFHKKFTLCSEKFLSIFSSLAIWKSLFLLLNYSTYIMRRREILYSNHVDEYMKIYLHIEQVSTRDKSELDRLDREYIAERQEGSTENKRVELMKLIANGIHFTFSKCSKSINDYSFTNISYINPFTWFCLIPLSLLFHWWKYEKFTLILLEYLAECWPEIIFNVDSKNNDIGMFEFNNAIMIHLPVVYQEYLAELLNSTPSGRQLMASYIAKLGVSILSGTSNTEIGGNNMNSLNIEVEKQAKMLCNSSKQKSRQLVGGIPNYMKPTRLTELRRMHIENMKANAQYSQVKLSNMQKTNLRNTSDKEFNTGDKEQRSIKEYNENKEVNCNLKKNEVLDNGSNLDISDISSNKLDKLEVKNNENLSIEMNKGSNPKITMNKDQALNKNSDVTTDITNNNKMEDLETVVGIELIRANKDNLSLQDSNSTDMKLLLYNTTARDDTTTNKPNSSTFNNKDISKFCNYSIHDQLNEQVLNTVKEIEQLNYEEYILDINETSTCAPDHILSDLTKDTDNKYGLNSNGDTEFDISNNLVDDFQEKSSFINNQEYLKQERENTCKDPFDWYCTPVTEPDNYTKDSPDDIEDTPPDYYMVKLESETNNINPPKSQKDDKNNMKLNISHQKVRGNFDISNISELEMDNSGNLEFNPYELDNLREIESILDAEIEQLQAEEDDLVLNTIKAIKY